MIAESSIQQRGSAKLGCLIAAGAVVLLGLILAVTFAGRYNSLVSLQESTEAAWSEIDNQYKRRYDLIPQLVSTVKGAADFEKSTLESVTEARASVGRAQLPAGLPNDPAQLQSYIQAQQGLGAALGRMFAVVERYPELKANQNFPLAAGPARRYREPHRRRSPRLHRGRAPLQYRPAKFPDEFRSRHLRLRERAADAV